MDASSASTTEFSPTIDEDDDSSENFYEKQVLKLTTVASVSSIVANILISFTIIKYKNLRRDITYIIILHLILVQILSLFLDEILLWFFTYFGTPLMQYHTEFCVMFVGVRLMNGISFLIIILLVCNWYTKLYCSESGYVKFSKFYKLPLAFIYIISVMIYPILTKLCLKRDVFVTFYIVLSFQIIMLLFTVFMNIAHKIKKRNSLNIIKDAGLGVANIIVLFCTPAYFFLVLAYFNWLPVYVVLFADVLATGLFPFLLFYLYKYDRNFQMYFKRMFACQGRSTESESVSYNLINGAES